MALSYSMDKIGPLARSAEDCARVFAAIAGHDFSDRSTLSIDKAAFTYSGSLDFGAKPLRVGILTDAWKKIGVPLEAYRCAKLSDMRFGARKYVNVMNLPDKQKISNSFIDVVEYLHGKFFRLGFELNVSSNVNSGAICRDDHGHGIELNGPCEVLMPVGYATCLASVFPTFLKMGWIAHPFSGSPGLS
jgi:hypothetical protein